MNSPDSDEGRHQKTLALFLRIAIETPLTSLEDALAESIGKTFFPSDVQIQWRISRRDGLVDESQGCWIDTTRGNFESGSMLGAAALTWTEASPIGDYKFARASTDYLEGFRINKVNKKRGNGLQQEPEVVSWQELEIFFRRASSSMVNEIVLFRRNITASTVLFQTFMSLKAARLSQSPRTNHNSFLSYLKAAERDIVKFMSYSGTGELIEQEVELVIHEVFGLAWDVQRLVVHGAAEALGEFAARASEASEHGSTKLKCLCSVLIAAQGGQPQQIEVSEDRDVILDSIAHWTWLHARSRSLNPSEHLQGGSVDPSEIRSRFLGLLGLLHRRLPQGNHPIKTATLSSWLRLWFCAELWQSLDGSDNKLGQIPAPERARLYRDLTYVIRESLRGMLYGERAEFRFQPVALAAALRTLVEQHAVWVLGLPQALELWGILREIGGINLGGGPFYAAGHLQHVLEMYICGAWICAIKLHEPGTPLHGSSVRQILAGGGTWRPAEGKQVEFQRAFGLAVLLHDIGTLLFPFWPRRAEDLANVDGPARKRLKSIRGVLNQGLEQLLPTCERELVEAGIFDPAKEPKIHEWIEECIEEGQADHSVLGAWYLVRIAKSAPSLLSSVVRQAARAILFHGINTQPIRTDEDPVAALLVLCDELIVWRQSHEPPAPNEAGRYIHFIAGELRPEESIFLDLSMPGLYGVLERNREGKPSKLAFTLDRNANVIGVPPDLHARSWPVLKAALQQPERLPTPAYKLWLLTSQNLGRIVPLQEILFGPVLYLQSTIPRHPALSIREIFAHVLPRASLSLRPCLQRWLSQYSSLASDSEESVTCGPTQPFCERRLPPLFAELERLVEAVVHEEVLRHQDPPQRRVAS